MSPLFGIIMILSLFLGLIAIRVPVAVALAMTSLVGIVANGLDPINVVSQSYRGIDSFTLLAVPFFLALGFLISRTSVSDRLMELAAIIVGRVRGGLGHINIIESAFFSGLSGSAVADTTSEGPIIIPRMVARGYSAEYSAAITCATSTMGLIIPPSILMVVFAATLNTSVAALFLAGFTPGILIAFFFLVLNHFEATRKNIDKGRFNADLLDRPRRKRVVVLRAMPVMFLTLIIISGVRFGVFTATEAGAFGFAYTFILTVFFYRDIEFSALPAFFRDTVLVYSMPMLAVAASGPFGWMLTFMEADTLVTQMIQALSLTPFTFMLLVIAVFMILGTFLDGIPAVIIFAPLFAPAAAQLGIHPVHLGIVVCSVLAVGLITPPYGLCLLIAARLADVPVSKVLRPLLPFILIEVGVAVLLAASSDLALFIPHTFAPDLFR